MTDMKQIERMQKVLDCAFELGMTGLVVLSPICPDCNTPHQFEMMSDMDEEMTTQLLRHWTMVTHLTPSKPVPGKSKRQ